MSARRTTRPTRTALTVGLAAAPLLALLWADVADARTGAARSLLSEKAWDAVRAIGSHPRAREAASEATAETGANLLTEELAPEGDEGILSSQWQAEMQAEGFAADEERTDPQEKGSLTVHVQASREGVVELAHPDYEYKDGKELPPGDYAATISAEGYRSQEKIWNHGRSDSHEIVHLVPDRSLECSATGEPTSTSLPGGGTRHAVEVEVTPVDATNLIVSMADILEERGFVPYDLQVEDERLEIGVIALEDASTEADEVAPREHPSYRFEIHSTTHARHRHTINVELELPRTYYVWDTSRLTSRVCTTLTDIVD